MSEHASGENTWGVIVLEHEDLSVVVPDLLEALVTVRELVQTFLVAGDPDASTKQRLDVLVKVCNQGLAKIEGRP